MNPPRMKVFVHLAENKDAAAWARARQSGKLVGINDETPYGYGRAEKMGCDVTFSRSRPEAWLTKYSRLALRALLGFDMVHAWRQRAELDKAEVVWTHTESQYLAIAAMKAVTHAKYKIIGQSVWLMDTWPSLSWPRRVLFRALIRHVDVMTFHSPLNVAAAKREFPEADVRLVRFGIPTEGRREPQPYTKAPGEPVKLVAFGNDRHRDWKTLIEAVKGWDDVSLRIMSTSVPARLWRGVPNVHVAPALTQDDFERALGEAAVVCVPLKENLHASGATAVQEGVLFGKPVVATKAGGLEAYFPEGPVRYVGVGDVEGWRRAVQSTLSDTVALPAAAKPDARPSATEYVARHVQLSQEMLGATRQQPAASLIG